MTNFIICENGLDMTHSRLSVDDIPDLFKYSSYWHSPVVDEDLILAYSSEDKVDGRCHAVFIYTLGLLLSTARTLESIFSDYGRKHEISDWTAFQKAIAYLISGTVKLAPYATSHSVFLRFTDGHIININHISGYLPSKVPSQKNTHTDIFLSTGAVIEVPMGYKTFQKRFNEGGVILIALRKLFRFVFKNNKTESIYFEPFEINTFLLKDMKKNKVKEDGFSMDDFKKALYFFEKLEKQLKDSDITAEVLAQYDSFTQKMIREKILKKRGKKCETNEK